MFQRAWSWLERVPLADRAERRTAAVVQLLSLLGIAWVLAALVLSVLHGRYPEDLARMALTALLVPVLGATAWLLRRGRARAGLVVAVAGTFFPVAGLIAPGLAQGAPRIPLLFIPLVLSSLLLGRRALVAALLGCVATLSAAALRDEGFLGGPGSLVPAKLPLGTFGQALLVLAFLAVVVDWFSGVLRDGLERALRREADLKASEERLRLSFATSPDPMNLVCLTDGRYVEVNDAFTRFTGWTAGEMVGHTSAERQLWVDRDQRDAIVERVARGDAVTNVEATFRAKDGTIRTGLLSARALGIGGVPHLFAIVRDVTDRRREEQERLELVEELRHAQKMEAFGRLTGGVAHDFNNILTSMLCTAQLVMDELPRDHAIRADVEQFESDALRAAELTRQILAIVRKHDQAPRVVRVEEQAAGLEKLLRRVMGASIRVETRYAEDGWPVFIDPGQLEQLLLNLAVNARDAMPAGGALTIATENVPPAAADHGGPPRGAQVRLTVADTGVGMAPEVLANAFKPFFSTKGDKGTGLGLSTCAEIVRTAGGDIRVESAPGTGTRFTITLPRAAAVAGPPEAPTAVDLHGTETILVIEDDPAIRRLAVRALEPLGYAVLVAASASEALAKSSRHGGRLDALVVDYELPDGSGPEVAARLVEQWPRLPVLLVSGSPDAAARLDAGAVVQFMPKPYTSIDLARRVRLLIDGAAVRAG